MISTIQKYILAALAFLGVIAGALIVGKAKGKAQATQDAAAQQVKTNEAIAVRQINETTEAAKSRVEAIEGAHDANAKVNRLDAAAIAGELRDKWSRPE